jgi:PKD domain-containing protein
MTTRRWLLSVCVGVMAACGGGSPARPTSTESAPPSGPGTSVATPPPPSNQPPTAAVKVDLEPADGEVPLTVRVNMCRSTDADPGDVLSFSLDFGDGTLHGACAAEHTYAVPGGHRVLACVGDGQEGHTQCRTVAVTARAPNAAPDLSNVRVDPTSIFSSTLSFVVWDDQEPVRWSATVRPGTPGTYPGCFEDPGPGPCSTTIRGEAGVGRVTVWYRDGFGPNPGFDSVIITVRVEDAHGKAAERTVTYPVRNL